MPNEEVILSVKAGLDAMIKQLDGLGNKAREVNDALGQTGKGVSSELANNTKDAEDFLGKLRTASLRTADQMRRDFKTLLSIGALGQSVNLASQFSGTIRETLSLNDAIRKLSATYGIADRDRARWQAGIMRGLGAVGLSSEVGAQTLQGLSKTPVRGEGEVLSYAKTSGMLASVAGGNAGDIAEMLARVIQARGGNVHDLAQKDDLAENVRRVKVATGREAPDTLRAMEQLYLGMPEDLRKRTEPRALANMAGIGARIPGSMGWLEHYSSMKPVERQKIDQQMDVRKILAGGQFNQAEFQRQAGGILGRIGFDPRASAETLGLSQEDAEGFVRLARSGSQVADVQGDIAHAAGTLYDQFMSSKTAFESLDSAVNQVTGSLSKLAANLTQGGTDLLSAGQGTGALAVVGGTAMAAAILASLGFKGVGGALNMAAGAGLVATKGAPIPVFVVNMGLGGPGGSKPGLVDQFGNPITTTAGPIATYAAPVAPALAGGAAMVAVAAAAANAQGGKEADREFEKLNNGQAFLIDALSGNTKALDENTRAAALWREKHGIHSEPAVTPSRSKEQ